MSGWLMSVRVVILSMVFHLTSYHIPGFLSFTCHTNLHVSGSSPDVLSPADQPTRGHCLHCSHPSERSARLLQLNDNENMCLDYNIEWQRLSLLTDSVWSGHWLEGARWQNFVVYFDHALEDWNTVYKYGTVFQVLHMIIVLLKHHWVPAKQDAALH